MERKFYWDNLKAILIFLVVFAHILLVFEDIMKFDIVMVIYLFHMPLFCFMSGYFSKNLEKSQDTALKGFLFVYLIFNLIYGAVTKRGVMIFTPLFTHWYLLTMFFWKISLKDLVKIKFILPISVLLALFSGTLPEMERFLSAGRTIGFLPFFLAGYFFKDTYKDKLKKVPLSICIILFLLVAGFGVLASRKDLFPLRFLYFSYPYRECDLTDLYGIVMRIICFLGSFIISGCLLRFIPDKKTIFTSLGKYTLLIYLGHPYVILLLEKTAFLRGLGKPVILFAAFVISALTLILFGNRYVSEVYNKGMNRAWKLVSVNGEKK